MQHGTQCYTTFKLRFKMVEEAQVQNMYVILTNCKIKWNSCYTRKNAHVVTSLQTSCNKSVHKLSTSCVRTACSWFVVTSLEQVVKNL